MVINRDRYLQKLISRRGNGLIKVITGVRRCGKSFLLFKLFREWLIAEGVAESRIIELALDELSSARYRNPLELDAYIRERVKDGNQTYYIFIDEIQMAASIRNPYIDDPSAKIGFVDVLLGLMKLANADIYVTGSNSRMLSSDVLTEFRGRGDEVRVNPLSYAEFRSAYAGDGLRAWREYCTYGGLPFVLSLAEHEAKSKYLKDLFAKTYLADVLERGKISDSLVMEDLLNVIASSIGSLTNPTRLANTFRSELRVQVSANTISRYLDCLVDAFILRKAHRYDVRGSRLIGSPLKYYFVDVGLRNARLNFRQQEESHIMENIVFNELAARDFDVDVGVVEQGRAGGGGKKARGQLEIDFVANKSDRRYYVQCALTVESEEKRRQESASLLRVRDSFKKIVVVRDGIIPWHDESGLLYIGIEQFLLDERAMDL